MKSVYKRRLANWACLLSLALFVFLFLHECGHGIGARLDGERVSTGFNRVGDLGKHPGDPDFRAGHVITGRLGWGGLLGPLTNWFFALVFTGWIMSFKQSSRASLLLGAVAVVNGFMRFVPMAMFFINAGLGHLSLEDEVAWGLGSVDGLGLPMSFDAFQAVARSEPELILQTPGIYAWPIFSIGISLLCLILSYRKLLALYRTDLPTRASQVAFVFMPMAVWPVVFALANTLDRVVRINW
jgi:hypothetical protein